MTSNDMLRTEKSRLAGNALRCHSFAMMEGRASQTAAFVAGVRALGVCLPEEVRLSVDPYGRRFAPPLIARVTISAERHPALWRRLLFATPIGRIVLWTQLRTRAIDDMVMDFVERGGRQLVILGAGFDCRALRLSSKLANTRVFEVDFRATQERKRALLASDGDKTRIEYVSWDFERSPPALLPSKLVELGFSKDIPCLTILEGVIPYLTDRAVEETLLTAGAFSASGSRIVLHYIERRLIEHKTIWHRFAARSKEPFRFGFDPQGIGARLEAFGFHLLSDRTDNDLAGDLFPDRWRKSVSKLQGAGGRIALAERMKVTCHKESVY